MKSVFLDFATVSNGDLDPSALHSAAPNLQCFPVSTENEVAARMQGATIVLTNKLPMTRERMRSASELRLIALAATGTNNVDLIAARELGIAVCNIRDYCTPSVAQHVLGTILALTHRFYDYGKLVSNGTWSRGSQFTMLDFPVRELAGRQLGVVGYGALGRAVARVCETALGMQVIVANRLGGDTLPGRYDLPELLARADVLTLHCPLTSATSGMIGRRELALMKRDALIINTARGGLIDSAALADALRAGQLGGAAIDVLPQEPPIDGSPLFAPDLPNLLLTPHTAWAARESRQRCIDAMAANIADFLGGGRRGRVV